MKRAWIKVVIYVILFALVVTTIASGASFFL
ncbi:stressosome-associated protein Prli42 [Lihuaxuella thermophila]